MGTPFMPPKGDERRTIQGFAKTFGENKRVLPKEQYAEPVKKTTPIRGNK